MPQQVARLLQHPRRVRLAREREVLDAAAADGNEGEHVETAQPDRVDREEVTGEDRLAVRSEEVAPRLRVASRCWRQAGLGEDVADNPVSRSASPPSALCTWRSSRTVSRTPSRRRRHPRRPPLRTETASRPAGSRADPRLALTPDRAEGSRAKQPPGTHGLTQARGRWATTYLGTGFGDRFRVFRGGSGIFREGCGGRRTRRDAGKRATKMVRNAMKKGLPGDRLRFVTGSYRRGGPFRCCTPVWISVASVSTSTCSTLTVQRSRLARRRPTSTALVV